ncbi:unnamed protein product [Ectocarpus sp. CCAP 1310/34]|nr:unnamed protein product [Ectocarpus sp. CCAP 1310/34]
MSRTIDFLSDSPGITYRANPTSMPRFSYSH